MAGGARLTESGRPQYKENQAKRGEHCDDKYHDKHRDFHTVPPSGSVGFMLLRGREPYIVPAITMRVVSASLTALVGDEIQFSSGPLAVRLLHAMEDCLLLALHNECGRLRDRGFKNVHQRGWINA
jgi:hypothetical protein